MNPELASLIPNDKHDVDAVIAAAALGWPAVRPIIGALLEWSEDSNWPVARELAPFLISVGAPLAPYVRDILAGDDGTWKYHLIVSVVAPSAALRRELEADLRRIVREPTDSERLEEVDLVALAVLGQP